MSICVHLWFTLRDGSPIRPIIVEIEIEIGIEIDSCPGWHLALLDRSIFTAGLCQYHNNTVARPGSPCPNPIPPPFDTDTDSDTDPEPASPSTFAFPTAVRWESLRRLQEIHFFNHR